MLADELKKASAVSIHASVKDATYRGCHDAGNRRGFNPRICKRCDHVSKGFKMGFCGFNPRICKRCDFASLVH